MGLAFGLLLILLVGVLGVLVFLITGIVFVIIGARQKKKGGTGTIGKVGIGFLIIPFLIVLYAGGNIIWRKVMIKCVADEWRFSSINAGEGNAVRDMLRSMLVSIDDEDTETIRREFAPDIRDDRHFDDTVDDFFDDLDDLDVEFHPEDFLSEWGESMFFDNDRSHGKYRYDIGYLYNAEIDGQTYYIYVRICPRDDMYRDDIGLEQFIVCTEDKVDELYEIIDDKDDDIYLGVL